MTIFEDEMEDFDIKKDIRDIKKSLSISKLSSGCYVIALAINKDYELNRNMEISTRSGIPLTHEVHNMVRDSFHFTATDFYEIGLIPVSYTAIMENLDWRIDVPLPFSIVKRYMNEDQKKSFTKWKSFYNKNTYDISFVQLLSAF
jgi:hypothetical protein